jgi:hypothetical protein
MFSFNTEHKPEGHTSSPGSEQKRLWCKEKVRLHAIKRLRWYPREPLNSVPCSTALHPYSETCEIRTLLAPAIGVPNSILSLFHRAICTENNILGPDEVSLFHRNSSIRWAAFHRFHCIRLHATHWSKPSGEAAKPQYTNCVWVCEKRYE